MGRPKKTDSGMLVQLVEEFYETEAKGNPSRLKYTDMAAFAKDKGYAIEAYDLRRDENVRRKLEELKALHDQGEAEQLVSAYRNLDVDALLRHAGGIEDLKSSIRSLDAYWRRIYDESISVKRENERLSQNIENRQEVQKLRNEVEALSSKQVELQGENRRLAAENAYLKRVLRSSLYPAVAQELLRQDKLPVPDNHTVRPDALPMLIEGRTPQPFTGEQEQTPKPLTHQEKLLSQMKDQVMKR